MGPQLLPVYGEVDSTSGARETIDDGEGIQVSVEYFPVREAEEDTVLWNHCQLEGIAAGGQWVVGGGQWVVGGGQWVVGGGQWVAAGGQWEEGSG